MRPDNFAPNKRGTSGRDCERRPQRRGEAASSDKEAITDKPAHLINRLGGTTIFSRRLLRAAALTSHAPLGVQLSSFINAAVASR
jgi:hypothetical protein